MTIGFLNVSKRNLDKISMVETSLLWFMKTLKRGLKCRDIMNMLLTIGRIVPSKVNFK